MLKNNEALNNLKSQFVKLNSPASESVSCAVKPAPTKLVEKSGCKVKHFGTSHPVPALIKKMWGTSHV